MKNPCYNPVTGEDCPRRKPGCGAHCKEWNKYVAKRDGIYQARHHTVELNTYEIDVLNKRRTTRKNRRFK